MATRGLCCCTRAFSSCGAQGSYCCGFSCYRAQAPGCVGSVAVVPGWHKCLVAPKHVGSFPDQGLNLSLEQADSLPLSHQGSPQLYFWICELPVHILCPFFNLVAFFLLIYIFVFCLLSFIYSHEYFLIDVPSLLTNWAAIDWIGLKMLSCSYNGILNNWDFAEMFKGCFKNSIQ